MIINTPLECIFPPNLLNKDWKINLFEILKNKYEETAQLNGYIKKVNKVIDIIHNRIDSNHNITIKTFCECDMIVLKVGNIMRCNIDMIHQSGVFVNLSNIKILVPNKNQFECRDNQLHIHNKIYNKGDEIDVKITNIRYEKNKYSCLGIFIEDI